MQLITQKTSVIKEKSSASEPLPESAKTIPTLQVAPIQQQMSRHSSGPRPTPSDIRSASAHRNAPLVSIPHMREPHAQKLAVPAPARSSGLLGGYGSHHRRPPPNSNASVSPGTPHNLFDYNGETKSPALPALRTYAPHIESQLSKDPTLIL